ncbi:hypothetical protein [Streptomyces sp. ME19-01-6]|uniref:hypothetical protein n=1 Tax=Streptomyces sp. ME19-01-6 TaxID=3028686 RepID=UPI0029ACF7F0|nr:hypothetical protein [Streptomyces sp. ME19-01-6]MDX3230639.1 hypothetical protein [Streptomyces sp. ME19-01-6]
MADYMRISGSGSDLGILIEVKVTADEMQLTSDEGLAGAVKDYVSGLPGITNVTATAFTTVNNPV